MSYELIEVSIDQGKPIYLYEFVLNDTKWTYCTSAKNRNLGGVTYEALPISDGGIRQIGEPSSDAFSVTLPSSVGVAQVFIGTPPSSSVYVRVRHMHDGDIEAPIVYVGEVTQADFPEPGVCKITCLPLAASLEREGLRLGWQRTCPYAVYDQATCKADKAAHRHHGTITNVQNGIVTAAAFATVPSGRLNGGFLEWDDPIRGVETRGIDEHIGDSIRVFGMSDGLYYGQNIRFYPGCDQLKQTCIGVFDNLIHNGGFENMPGVSPFDGNPIF